MWNSCMILLSYSSNTTIIVVSAFSLKGPERSVRWVHAQSGALERCVKMERSKAMSVTVTAGLWNATSERISLGLQISLPAWSAGLKWQPSNLICQEDRLLVAPFALGPAAPSNLWKSQFPLRRGQQVLTVKQDIPVFFCQWSPHRFIVTHVAPYLMSFSHSHSSFCDFSWTNWTCTVHRHFWRENRTVVKIWLT